MQMKHLLVALLVLLALVGTAVAADDVTSAESVEIRSTILHYTTTGSTLLTGDYAAGTATGYFGAAAPASPDALALDAKGWAGLYYNLDSDRSTELMLIKPTGTNKVDIKYTTAPVFQAYDYDWKDDGTNASGYAMIGFFAEPYVALGNKNLNNQSALSAVKANKIAKLVIDSDERYTLKTGATLEIGSGYSFLINQIDVDGNKAQITLMHDGQAINSSIATTNGTQGGDWIFDLKVLGESNMQVMRIHVKSVFQGTESSLVEIEGIWMVDYLNAIEVKSDVDYGKFEASGVGSDRLTYEAEGIALSADMETDLGRGIILKTEKNFNAAGHTASPDADKYYLLKVFTEPGTYEIRSSVYNWSGTITGSTTGATANPVPGNGTFTYENFAAFYYDIDSGAQTEVLYFDSTNGEIADGKMVYVTTPVAVEYAYDWTRTVTTPGNPPVVTTTPEQFYIMGFFGEKYVPLNLVDVNGTLKSNSFKAEKMAKLVIDDDARYTLKTGATLELGEGYSLIVNQIDVDGNKAQLTFLKDGQEINGSIVSAGTTAGGDWIFRLKVLNEADAQVFRVHVKSVFQGTESSLVEIEGLWLMDYLNAQEVKSDYKVGVMEFQSGGSNLTFVNDGKFTISQDMDKLIANNMYMKTADNATATNYYLYVSAIVGDGDPTTPVDPPVDPPVEPVPPVDPPAGNDGDDKTPTFWGKYWKYIVIAIILIIIIAAAAYYFLVMKKQ